MTRRCSSVIATGTTAAGRTAGHHARVGAGTAGTGVSVGNLLSGMGVPGTGKYEDLRTLDGLIATVRFTEVLPATGIGPAFVAANPALKTRFDFYLANIVRQAEHTLSPEGEAILAIAGAPLQAPGEIAGQLRSSDIPWPTIKLSDGKEVRLDSQGYTLNRDAPNRADRKAVFDAFWGAHGKFQNSFGATYNAKVKSDIFYAKARKYPTSLAAALSGNNVPEAVYRTLVAEANKGLPQLHRYFDLRRRMLKLPDIAYYDIYPPLVSLDRPFSLDQMRTLTLKAVEPLGADCTRVMDQDVADGVNKNFKSVVDKGTGTRAKGVEMEVRWLASEANSDRSRSENPLCLRVSSTPALPTISRPGSNNRRVFQPAVTRASYAETSIGSRPVHQRSASTAWSEPSLTGSSDSGRSSGKWYLVRDSMSRSQRRWMKRRGAVPACALIE